MSDQALQRIEPTGSSLDAAGRKQAVDDLLNKVALVMETMSRTMTKGEHYGTIPGCGDKPTLLKPGAEKLGLVFRLRPQFGITMREQAKGHREYEIVCSLSDGTQGVGICSTMEAKYRYRKAERLCPACGKPTIRQSKTDARHPSGGFYCWAKIGGCGVQFEANDERITMQETGKVEHDNPADFYNTILKMAKKRAHVDAILTATAASDIFTQDVEEMVGQADATSGESKPVPPPPEKQKEDLKAKAAEPKLTHLPVVNVKMVTEKTGQKKDGTSWTAYFVLLNDGINDLQVGTFSKTISGMAKTLAEDPNNQAEAEIKPGNKEGTWELVSLIPKPTDKATDDMLM